MTQKDKVKELVGRGLSSYHTKALQQIDRIERKNKEQNHKINILTSELDNDYLTKTEEGSVVSLEHSKEGMVYLDGLEGNTLVNYCTDGAKELTLNGDIDVEGTSVTLTEGVDNGLVDVICEGNTLVNLYEKFPIKQAGNGIEVTDDKVIITTYEGHRQLYLTKKEGKLKLFKPNTTYTIIANVEKNTLIKEFNIINTYASKNGCIANTSVSVNVGQVGLIKGTFNTVDEVTYQERDRLGFIVANGNSGELILTNGFVILEGDWTNKEIPKEYFEGMKSVGELEDNKFEILSAKVKEYITGILGVYHAQRKPIFSFRDNPPTGEASSSELEPYLKYFNYCGSFDNCNNLFDYYRVGDGYWVNLGVWGVTYNDSLKAKEVINKYIGKCEGNKKEISLNKPLRGLPNGVCDKFVKQGGNWYVERNCGEIVFNGSEGSWMASSTNGNVATSLFYIKQSDRLAQSIGLCDRFSTLSGYGTNEPEGIFYGSDINIRINVNKLKTNDLEGFKEWLQQNPTTIVYQLASPIYEEITDVELITYLDTTHISTNSTIPCNMKIQNSGYNAIIKPSTQYTVALDTNKNGAIGINLGGAKVTTTNNVATITTPATLTDDSLRLYGKGIKASKVRLLEGNKTNWIPSHFEGMKSSFEDKLQEDGTFKMEILSNNRNLLDSELVLHGTDRVTHNKPIYFQKGHTYTFAIEGLASALVDNSIQIFLMEHAGYPYPTTDGERGVVQLITSWARQDKYTFVPIRSGYFYIQTRGSQDTIISMPNVVVVEGVNVIYEENKSNKIQYLLNEPLRGIGNIKDRFVFKDGKLMVERNCIERDLTYFNFGTTEIKGNNFKAGLSLNDIYRQPTTGSNINIKCDKLASAFMESIIPCINVYHHADNNELRVSIPQYLLETLDREGVNKYFANNPHKITYPLAEPTYEEIPSELQKIILEGYENGTLFLDTNIPPTVTTTYSGETPIVKATKLNKSEVLKNTDDINDNIVPYLMDMDYRVVCLQLEGGIENVSMARLFGGTFEMLQRDILSNRYSKEEYKYRLDAYLSANKITHEEYTKLGDMLND